MKQMIHTVRLLGVKSVTGWRVSGLEHPAWVIGRPRPLEGLLGPVLHDGPSGFLEDLPGRLEGTGESDGYAVHD